MSERKNRKGRKIAFNLLTICVLLLGLSILLYPTFSDIWNKRRNASLIAEYNRKTEQISTKRYENIWNEAMEYNRHHRVNTILDVFSEDRDHVLTSDYESLLNPVGNGVMGYIKIPKIRQEIAIFHGTGAEVLECGTGHVEGTSLPIGGSGTHTVIAGHRGLPSARLFSDLDQMEPGDEFYLYILDETLAYRVDRISTVLPEEAEELAIVEDEDLVTLLTCTPYGVNTHRLLVRGSRTPFSPDRAKQQELSGQGGIPYSLVLLGATVAVIFVVLCIMIRIRNAKRMKMQKEQKEGSIYEKKDR